MLLDSTENSDSVPRSTLLDSILNASLNGIIAYESMRNRSGVIVDFRATTVNRVAQQILRLPDTEPGWLLLTLFPAVKDRGLFDQYVGVVETGESLRFETPYQNERINGWYDVAAVKLNDGFVITFSDITARQEAMQKLSERNALLDSILESSPGSIFNLTAVRDDADQVQDFRFGVMNEKAAQDITRDFGVNPVDRLLSDVNPDSRQTGQFDLFVNVLETGAPTKQEHFYEKFGLWYNTSIARIGDGIVITTIDITAEKQAVSAMAQQNELLAGILTTALSTIIVYDAIRDGSGQIQDFRLKLANPPALAEIKKWFNLDPTDRTLLEINPDARKTGQFNRYVEVMTTGQSMHREHFYPNINAWYDTHITKLGDGIVLTATDITMQKRAQQELEQQAGLMQTMLGGAINGVLLLKPVYDDQQEITDFTILAANPAVEALTGVVPEAAVGQPMRAVYPGYTQNNFFAYYRDAMNGQPGRIESYYEDEKGLRGWFDVSAVRQDETLVLTFTNTTETRQAQHGLNEAAANLQAVIDNSQTGIFVFSPVHGDAGEVVDFRFKAINKMVASLIGETPDEIRGDLASNWFISYRETEAFTRYITTLATGDEQRFDINYNVDGFDVWFDVRSVKLGDDVLVTFTDYTDLKRAQIALEQQARLLRSVLNGSDNGIMSFEAIRDEAGQIQDFRFLTMNEASAQMVGKRIEEVTGQPLLSVFPGNVESGLFDRYVHTTETGEPTRTEVYYDLDGLDFWLDISAQKLADGFVVTFTDISAIKRVTQAVAKSATELQTVIDTTQTAIFLIGPVFSDEGEVVDFCYRIANKAVGTFAGQDSSAALGTRVSAWFPDYFRNGLFDRYKDLYQAGGQTTFDFHYESDAVDAWINIVATRIDHEILVTFSDFTALKKLQQQLEASVLDLQRSNKNLEQFAYVASHDLQEPLRKIQQFGDILQASYASTLDEPGRDMLARMQSAADRMRVLIKDVLAYSRIATKREGDAPVDLNNLMRDVLSDLEIAISTQQAVLRIEPLPMVSGDASQLRQLFQNLFSNSLKFTQPGRRPELSLCYTVQRGLDTGLPVTAADETRQFYRLELSDNGIGFDPNLAGKIFQVFQRLHNRNEYTGTGIGLAIVQKVIENHRGYIRADGRPNEGATFTILLPVGQER